MIYDFKVSGIENSFKRRFVITLTIIPFLIANVVMAAWKSIWVLLLHSYISCRSTITTAKEHW